MKSIKEQVHSLKDKGAFHVVLGSFATKFVSFFGSIFLVRLLSKQEYGILSYYENIFGYFIILAGLGLSAGVLRYIVIAPTKGEKYECYRHAQYKGGYVNVLLLVLALLFVFLFPHPDGFRNDEIIGTVLMLCIPFIFCYNTCFSSFRGCLDNKNYALLSFITAFILVLARVVGAALFGLYGSVIFRLLFELLSAVICVLCVKRFLFHGVTPIQLSKPFKRQFDVYSIQLMLTDGLWAIFMLNDMFILGQLLGDESIIADYKVAFVIPANLSIIASSIGIFVAPYFTKYEHNGDYSWVRKNLNRVLLLSLGIMGVACILCFVLAKPIILLLYGQQYLNVIPLMQVLLVASFFNNGLRQTLANILSAVGKQVVNLIIAGVGIVLQITLDIIIIPKYGGIGLAWASSIVYFFMGISLLIIVYKNFYNIKLIKNG